MDKESTKRTHLRIVKEDESSQRALYPQKEAFEALFDDLLTIYVKTGKHLEESQEEKKEKSNP